MKDSETITIEAIKKATTKRELAEILDYPYKLLSYNLYVLPPEKRYKTFSIPKRGGGSREICAPNCGIKNLQRRLATVLLESQTTKSCVHGYVKGKSIKTNAEVHQNRRIVINLDLKDFFPSINFGRVRGLFMSRPFEFNEVVSTALAQICCHNGHLPQGAPTSPVISNYICRRLDNALIRLCKENKVSYSRYADDITLSTNLHTLPAAIGKIENRKIVLSEEIKGIILDNGFIINEDKTRYALHDNRQEVTGLIVNERTNVSRKYVKRVRAMLHAWKQYGIEDAAKEHFEKYNYKNRHPEYPAVSYKNILTGMLNYIGYIKGQNDPVYARLYDRIKQLDSDIKLAVPENIPMPKDAIIVCCEGRSDRYHLQAAIEYFHCKGEFLELNLYIHKWREDLDINNDKLMQMCKTAPLNPLKKADRMEIYLFDRDDPKYTKADIYNGKQYHHWGSNVYSAMLPVPAHRTFNEICIEHYYSDEDLFRKDKSGRRLYTTEEFNPKTGNHRTEAGVYFSGKRNELNKTYPKILESNVYDSATNMSKALSKMNFAKNIYNKAAPFDEVSFEYFRPIFELFEEINIHSKANTKKSL